MVVVAVAVAVAVVVAVAVAVDVCDSLYFVLRVGADSGFGYKG
jgi:hypothetical protein